MPSSVSGYTGAEIVTMVKGWVGNQSAEFETFLNWALPLAELRFSKLHSWKFLYKQNLPLTVVTGTNEYTLDSSTIGFYMPAEDVSAVYSETNNVYLKKTTVERLRRADPAQSSGVATSLLALWAPTSDNKILVYPKTFTDTALRIDGKITPSALFTLSNYPTIPLRYQDSFIQYVISLALDRENDDRAPGSKQDAMGMIKQDIQADMAKEGGGNDEDRIKHGNEASLDGISADPSSLYNDWAWNSR